MQSGANSYQVQPRNIAGRREGQQGRVEALRRCSPHQRTFDVYQVNGAWTEGTLTYNTPPPLLGGSAPGGNPVAISTSSLNQFVLIDITGLVHTSAPQ